MYNVMRYHQSCGEFAIFSSLQIERDWVKMVCCTKNRKHLDVGVSPHGFVWHPY